MGDSVYSAIATGASAVDGFLSRTLEAVINSNVVDVLTRSVSNPEVEEQKIRNAGPMKDKITEFINHFQDGKFVPLLTEPVFKSFADTFTIWDIVNSTHEENFKRLVFGDITWTPTHRRLLANIFVSTLIDMKRDSLICRETMIEYIQSKPGTPNL